MTPLRNMMEMKCVMAAVTQGGVCELHIKVVQYTVHTAGDNSWTTESGYW